MALYLVVHTPREEAIDAVHPPSRLAELAADSVGSTGPPRWIKAWSPDLHDDRIFSLWEAEDAAEIERVLHDYGFLNDREAQPLRVHEWGPDDVLTDPSA